MAEIKFKMESSREDNYLLAVCEDKYGNLDESDEYIVYFINNSPEPIDEMVMQTGKYLIADGVLIRMLGEVLEINRLSSMDYIEIEKNNSGNFKFTLWYYIIIRVGNKIKHKFFQVPKGLSMPLCDNIPVLERQGFLALYN